jgi:hypothetical protein
MAALRMQEELLPFLLRGIDFLAAQALFRSLSVVHARKRCRSMNSSEFDQRFEAGESLIESLDLSSARRPRQQQKRVNVDVPIWMVEQLDREASRLGVTRQSILKVWLAECLERRHDAQDPPTVMGSQPCIRGLRITLGMVVGLIASGCSRDRIREAYPQPEPADIDQALALS